jgi:hypothetical protein
MQQSNAWHSLQQGLGVPELWRSRTRTRRRRRKRSWGALWAYLLPVFLRRSTLWTRLALVSLTILRRKYGNTFV